jgi:hypothetical protein
MAWNRTRIALAEVHIRSHIQDRRGSEAYGLASQSTGEQPLRPGEEREVERGREDQPQSFSVAGILGRGNPPSPQHRALISHCDTRPQGNSLFLLPLPLSAE